MADDGMDSVRRRAASGDAAMLEALEPLSPASMRIFERPLRADAWDCTTAGAPAESTPRGERVPSTRRAPAKPKSDANAGLRRARHREREKREGMYLRACSQVLEQRLEELRQRQAARTDAERRAALLERNRAELWRSLARQRRLERGEAEKENARLRALWRSQQQFAEHMRRLSAVPRGLGPAGGLEARVLLSSFDTDVLDTLTRDLDALYEQSGRELAGMDRVDAAEARFPRFVHRDSASVDLVDVELLQTNYTVLRPLAWNRILSKFLARGGVRVDACPSQHGRTLAMKIRYQVEPEATRTIAGDDGDAKDGDAKDGGAKDGGAEDGDAEDRDASDVHFEVVLALRQYIVSPSREVVVWRSLNTGGGALAGLAAHETGYCAMHRSVDSEESTTLARVRKLELLAANGGERARWEELFSRMSLAVMEDDVKTAVRVL